MDSRSSSVSAWFELQAILARAGIVCVEASDATKQGFPMEIPTPYGIGKMPVI
jgi:hypothetical protein